MLAWMPLLNDVLPLGIPESVVTRQMTGQARASGLHALLRFLLARTARTSPALLIADDLHWFDGASASALGAATENLPGLMVLAGTRPLDANAPEQVSRLMGEAAGTCIDLDTLPRNAVGQLICNKLEATEVSDELAEFVFARTAGNPFYVEELVLALRGAKLIELSGTGIGLAPGVGRSALEALPDSLRGVIVSRVDALRAVEQFALKIASVIGREFSLRMVRDLYPAPEETADLSAAMQTLMREDVIRPAPPGVRGEYAFKHAILQDVVYDQLPFALRRELHAGTARWIERHEAQNLEPYYSELALHWERSENIVTAVDYLEKAADLSLRRYANRDAIAHAHKAKSLATQFALSIDAARLARWEATLGDAHHELFEYASATRHFRDALALAGWPLPQGRAALGLRLAGQLAEQLARRAGFTGRAGGERAALGWASHIHERLAEIAYFDSRPLDLLHATLASLNLAERARSTREIVDGFAALSIGFLQTGQRRLSSYYNRRSLEVAEREGTLADVAYAHLVNSVYWANQGGWAAVESSNARAAAIYRELGASVRWHQTQSVLYYVHALRGLYDRAERLLAEVRAALGRDTPLQVRSWIYACEMDVALARGEAPEALIALLADVQTPELHRADRLLCQGMIARARLALGQRPEALAAADAAFELLAASVPTAWHVTPGVSGVAEVYLAVAEATADRALLARAGRACDLLRRYSRTTRISAPRADLLAGRFERLRGNADRAFALWRRAARTAAALQLHVDWAAALRELGERSPGGRGAAEITQTEGRITG
jgi:adenylate cyclase